MRLTTQFLCGTYLFSAALLTAAPVTYQVSVNTSLVASLAGYIDMQFNPSILPGQQTASAQVQNFVTSGALQPADPNNGTLGDVSGSLTSSVHFGSSSSVNEYTEGIIFGNSLMFTLTLDGQMIESPANTGGGTTFYLSFLDTSGSYLLSNDPEGNTASDFFAGYVTVHPDGTVTTTANPGPDGEPPTVTFTAMNPTSSIPEPSTCALFAAGLAGLAMYRRRN